jgi:hypothetical protein
MKYLVKTHVLEWHTIDIIIEADSEEEVRKLAEEMEGDIYSDSYDMTDQVDIETIEPYEN